MPKLKQVSLSFHMFIYFLELWGVFLNIDKFLYITQNLKVEKFASRCWQRCLAESQATFLDQTVEGVLSMQHGEGTFSLLAPADNVSEGTDDMLIILKHKPAGILLNDRIWIS